MLDWLFDSAAFITRDHWDDATAFAYKLGSLGTAVAYFLIPLAMVYIWRKRPQIILHPWVLLGLATFILLCGLTHLLDFLAFSWPAYRFFALVLNLTMATSWITLAMLPALVRNLAGLKTVSEYEHQARGRAHEAGLVKALQEEMEKRHAVLKARVADLEAEVRHIDFMTATVDTTKKLLEKVRSIANGHE